MACPLRERLPPPLQGHSLPHPTTHRPCPKQLPALSHAAATAGSRARAATATQHGSRTLRNVWGGRACSPNLCTVCASGGCDRVWRVGPNSTPAQRAGPQSTVRRYTPVHPTRLSPLYGLARHSRPVSRPLLSSRSLDRIHTLTVCVRSPLGRVFAAAAIVGQLATAHRRRLYHRPSPPFTRAGRACVHPTPSGDRRQQQSYRQQQQ